MVNWLPKAEHTGKLQRNEVTASILIPTIIPAQDAQSSNLLGCHSWTHPPPLLLLPDPTTYKIIHEIQNKIDVETLLLTFKTKVKHQF